MECVIKKLPKSQIELKIEVPVEEFNGFIEKAILDLGKDLEIKGFRKGKASREVIEREIGSEKILIEAADLAIKENYRKAVLENKIEPISQPRIEIKKLARGNELVFSAKTTVLPEIKLPDYKKIASKIKRREIIVEEKEIDSVLKWLQRSRAKFTLKNQPAQKGDFVEIEYWSSQIDGVKQKKGREDAFILGEGHFIPGFEEKLIGMRAGPVSASGEAAAGKEEKEFSLVIPEKHPLRKYGKEISLEVKMKSVQNVEFPEIGDEFARTLGKFEDLTGLKKNVKEGISSEKRQTESQRVRQEILEKIGKEVKCEIPEVLVEREKEQMLENLKKNVSQNLKIKFVDYLNWAKKNEKEILDSFLPQAQKEVKNFLVLKEIGKREKIEISQEEVREEMDKILKHYPNMEKAEEKLDPVKSREAGISPEAKLFNGVDPEKLKEYTKEAIKTEKTFQALENFARN